MSPRTSTYPAPLKQLAAGPIFVVGHPRSGTTWVYDLLTAHPQVAGALESGMFSVLGGVAGLGAACNWNSPPSWKRGLGALIGHHEMISDVRNLSAGWLARALQPHHRYLVEKSPWHLDTAPFIAEVFPEARFVQVVRDGRDVAVSVMAAARSWAPGWRREFGRSTIHCGRAWRRAVFTGRAHRGGLSERWLDVRYEELQGDKVAACARLFEFSRIPHDARMLEQVFEATDLQAGASAGRYRIGETNFRRAGRVGDWQERWGLSQAVAFDVVAGDALIVSGYEEDRLWPWRRRSARTV